jgi:curved DNA-binding protein CbpA
MQRNHPDKNTNLIESTARTFLIAQAYKVLSDPEQRLAYDETLFKRQPADVPFGSLSHSSAVFHGGRHKKPTTATHLRTWYASVLILSIICAGGAILVLSKRKTAPEPAAQETRLSLPRSTETNVMGMNSDLAEPKALAAFTSGKTGESAAELQARTISAFVTDLSIELTSADPAQTRVVHVLHIPNLGLRLATGESDRWTQRLHAQRSMLIQQLLTTLANAQYHELIQADGDLYLKKLIEDTVSAGISLEKATALPTSAQPSQATQLRLEALLPLSFSVR